MSRHAAKRRARGRDLTAELLAAGVHVRARSRGTLGEEMPEAYKDVSEVVQVVDAAGIGRRVARLRPVIVVKG
jgi:tRNA-splicing ligase RtcB